MQKMIQNFPLTAECSDTEENDEWSIEHDLTDSDDSWYYLDKDEA